MPDHADARGEALYDYAAELDRWIPSLRRT
jgi:hypothetical protein